MSIRLCSDSIVNEWRTLRGFEDFVCQFSWAGKHYLVNMVYLITIGVWRNDGTRGQAIIFIGDN